MKIALLTSLFYHKVSEYHGEDRIIFGGAEKYQRDLCRLIRDMGHEITVFQALPEVPKSAKPQVVVKEYDGVPIVCLPVNNQAWRYGGNTDLNTQFNEHAGFYDMRIYMMTAFSFPHVVRPAITISHGIYWDYPSSEYGLMSQDDRKEWLRRNLYGFTAPDVCVAVDSNVRRVLQAMEPGSESRVVVIDNFVDTKKFVPKAKEWEGKILFPRRMSMLRGSNDFLRASHDYPQYKYVACGQASDAALEAEAQAWAANMPHISFTWKPMDEMPQMYQDADIAVVPTRASEGLSLSLLESMATGLPIVTTWAGGIGDAVINGYNALVYDPNHESLGEYIHALAENPEMRKRLGERNRQIAVECFDIEIWRAKWRSVLSVFG